MYNDIYPESFRTMDKGGGGKGKGGGLIVENTFNSVEKKCQKKTFSNVCLDKTH